MSAAKKELERIETLKHFATHVAVEAGAIKECEGHGGTFIRQGDPDAEKYAYPLGTNKFKEGEVNGTREELMDAIKEAIDNSADECYACAELLAD